jgi:hypothetical protein
MIHGYNKQKIDLIGNIMRRTKDYFGSESFYSLRKKDAEELNKEIIFRFEIEYNKAFEIIKLYLKISNINSPSVQRYLKEQLIELFKLMFPKGVSEIKYAKKIPFLKIIYTFSELNRFIDSNIVKFRRISEANNATFKYWVRPHPMKTKHVFETTIKIKEYNKFLFDFCNVDYNEEKSGNINDLLEI